MSDLPKFEDTEELPSFENTQELPSFDETHDISAKESSDEIPMNIQAKTAAIPVAVGVEGMRQGVSNLGQAAVSRIGKLSPEEMATVTSRSKEYGKARSFQDLLDEYKNLGDVTREKGFSFAEQAKESLKGMGPVKGSDLIQSISRVQSAPLVDLHPSELPQPTTSKKAMEELSNISKVKQDLEGQLKTMMESGIESPGMNQQINDIKSQLDQVNARVGKLSTQAASDLMNPIQPTMGEISSVTGFPEEILSANPSLQTKRIGSQYGDVLSKEVDFLKGGDIPAYDVGKKYIQQLQDAAKYNMIVPDETAKFKQEIAGNVSEHLKSLPGSEEYTKMQGFSKDAIETEKGLKEFGIGLDSEGNYKVTNPNKIQKIYHNGNQSEISRLEKLINKAQTLGLNPASSIDAAKISQIDRFQSELPLASIKKRVMDAGDSKLASATRSIVGGALGGVPGVIAGTIAPSGTKLQELVALAKGSGAYKVASKASKALGPLAGLAVAGMTYNEATDRGLNVPEAIGATVGEIANPIPFTDVTGGYIAGKKEYQKSGEVLPSIGAAGEAYAKPLVSQAEKSAAGRAKNIAQNYNVEPSKIVNPQEKIANLEDLYAKFKSMVGSKGAEVTANTLDKAINGTEDQKVKADFLIQQNPMLRNKLK